MHPFTHLHLRFSCWFFFFFSFINFVTFFTFPAWISDDTHTCSFIIGRVWYFFLITLCTTISKHFLRIYIIGWKWLILVLQLCKSFEEERRLFYYLLDEFKLYVTPGQEFSCAQPGWFRLVFIQSHLEQGNFKMILNPYVTP